MEICVTEGGGGNRCDRPTIWLKNPSPLFISVYQWFDIEIIF